MKRLLQCYLLTVAFFGVFSANSQDFSNKGKDFWVGYGYHVSMGGAGGGTQNMVLYFATEVVTNVTVSVPGLGYSVTYSNIPANTIFTSNPLPKTGTQDCRLTTEGTQAKGIHITSDQPIVAYAHIYDNSVSGATLLFPTNTLGKEYYSINYKQVSNSANSNCWFYAIAVDTGTTVVQITPSANTLNHAAGTPFTVSLTQGQIVNVMGQLTSISDPFTGVDLTGSLVKSINSGTGGCKRIAVFSGSGKLSITCTASTTSATADNYIVQAFPKSAWGKRYLTAPTKNFENNFFRICVTDPTTVVKLNGTTLSGLVNNFYYEINTTAPGLIEADKPILVAQYITSQRACNNGSTGDPEIIYLSPVEQNIDKVILNSTPNYAITQHFINVVIKSSAAPSFRLDGSAVAGFQTHPQDPAFSYAQISVKAGQHILQADSGFNAIAYGYGNAESYGYNAGTNVKDLYQFASIQNQYATVNFPTACKNSPFFFSMTFPYQPTQIKWVFGATLNSMGINDTTITSPQYDSTWVVNGKQLYRYKLPSSYAVSATGTYPIKIFAQNPTSDGCSGEQEINYDLQVIERPSASFSFSSSGCVSDAVQFTDSSNTYGRPSVQWYWGFGDNQSSSAHNPSHLYSTAGSYNVKFALITDIGCISDTAQKTVILSQPPVAKFGASIPNCVGKTITFTDSSSSQNSNIVKWTWDFGDGSAQVVATSGAAQTHSFANAGNYNVSLQVESAGGCKSTVYAKAITVSSNPVADFTFGNACLPQGTMQFTNKSTISDGTQNLLTYLWKFGDGSTSLAKDTTHNYTTVGPYSATLVVTSNAGCVDSMVKSINTIYAQPKAIIAVDSAEKCFGGTLHFTDQSTAQNSTVTEWYWDFGDGTTSTQQNPTKQYANPGTYKVKLYVKSAIGCVSDTATLSVTVNPLPTADFTVSSPTCETNAISFTNASTANAGTITKWTWDFGDGSGTSNATSPTHTFAKYGTYTVSLQVETDKGCVSTLQSKTVDVHPMPNVGFTLPGACINDPVAGFTDTTSIADGSQSQFKWLWNFGDPNASLINNTSTAKNGQHKYIATGTYNVSLTVTSKDGCTASLTQQFTLNGAVPVISLGLNSTQICSNDSLVLTDNSTVTPGKLVKLEIYWDYNGDPTNKLVVNNPTKGASYTHAYPEFFTPATKTYHIKFVGYSGANCLTEKDTTITVKATPDVTFNTVAPVCASDASFQLQAGVTNLAGAGVFTGSGVSSAGLFNPASAGAGTHTIRYTYTGSNSCSNYKEQDITVYAVPTVTAGPDKFILDGGSTTLNGSGSGNNISYLWTPSTGLNNATIPEPLTTPADDITYTLTVTSADGCTASDDVFVKVLKAPTIPNVFTPNGDGINDKWEIKYIESYPGATVDVYNRYGSLVFHSAGYSKPWDGNYNGKPVPAGTYYYIVNPKNGRKPIAGFVDVIR